MTRKTITWQGQQALQEAAALLIDDRPIEANQILQEAAAHRYLYRHHVRQYFTRVELQSLREAAFSRTT